MSPERNRMVQTDLEPVSRAYERQIQQDSQQLTVKNYQLEPIKEHIAANSLSRSHKYSKSTSVLMKNNLDRLDDQMSYELNFMIDPDLLSLV